MHDERTIVVLEEGLCDPRVELRARTDRELGERTMGRERMPERPRLGCMPQRCDERGPGGRVETNLRQLGGRSRSSSAREIVASMPEPGFAGSGGFL